MTETESKTLKGPYVDGAWFNKPSETVFYCVDCANQKDEITEDHALMYDDMPDVDVLRCDECGEVFRDYSDD